MATISPKLRRQASKIKLLLLDVDGVLTDGGIFLTDSGEEIKRFDVRDGHGIRLLITSGIQVGFITGRTSHVVRHRARELGVRILHQGVHNKLAIYKQIKRKMRLKDNQIAYIGDDIVDLPLLREVGWAIAVGDSWAGLGAMADYVTRASGGRGAVREVVEILLKAQGKWRDTIKMYDPT